MTRSEVIQEKFSYVKFYVTTVDGPTGRSPRKNKRHYPSDNMEVVLSIKSPKRIASLEIFDLFQKKAA